MTDYLFKLPDIGEGIAEAEIVAWHVSVGKMVEEDAPLADLMTDKATVEISAPVSGRILKTAGKVGDQVAIGSVLAVFDVEDVRQEGLAGELTESREQLSAIATSPVADQRSEQAEADSHQDVATAAMPLRRVSASPAVRRRARDLGIDLSEVGRRGGERIRHGDLDAFLTYNSQYRPSGCRRADEQIQVVGLRRRIAENMAASKRHIPHFSYVEEIDVTKLEAMREDINANRGGRPKLTMLPLLIIAVCKAVAQFPMMNARYDDEAGLVIRSGAVHLGIATQTDAGLMVPVIRDAQDCNLWQLATEIRRLADAARSGKVTSAELSGSTLTITSLGPLGGICTTPVINRPEVAIIGPNRIVERPTIRNGQLEVAKLMNLSISCDHRVVDGWDAASFVQMIKKLIEAPAMLFVPNELSLD